MPRQARLYLDWGVFLASFWLLLWSVCSTQQLFGIQKRSFLAAQGSYASERPQPRSSLDVPSVRVSSFVSPGEFQPSADANGVTMEAFVEAPSATERSRRPETFQIFLGRFFVLIFVVFEERRHCLFSSGSAGKVFIFGSVDRNDDVEGK